MSNSWIEKYRPKHLKNIIGQNNIISTIKNMIKNNYSITNLLFYGMPGTGKTTTILSLCYELFGPNNFKNRVLELNASDERGIGVVRDSNLRFSKNTLIRLCLNKICSEYEIEYKRSIAPVSPI